MTMHEPTQGLLLNGLNGENPLGFLAAMGVAITANDIFPKTLIGWKRTRSGWRPLIHGSESDEQELSTQICNRLSAASTNVLGLNKKMPFDVAEFSCALRSAQMDSSVMERRDADMLTGLGTEIYPDKRTGQFQDTAFRMVRSGDSKGQGMLFYAQANLKRITAKHVHRALFSMWDYQDEGYDLRWDPLGDQRYALRWKDPSKSDLTNGPGTMLAANCLAVEAMRWFPTVVVGAQKETTGFLQVGRRETYFVWPIWTPLVGADTLRSLVTSPDLSKDPLPRTRLQRMGVEEVYRSQRIRPNQYYSNFTPASPA